MVATRLSARYEEDLITRFAWFDLWSCLYAVALYCSLS